MKVFDNGQHIFSIELNTVQVHYDFEEYGFLILCKNKYRVVKSSTQIQIQRENVTNQYLLKNLINSLLPEFSRHRVISHIRL